MTCDFCVGWSPLQWEAFAKKRSYKDRKRSSRHLGSLPPATATSPRAGTSSEVLRLEASSSSLASRGQAKGWGWEGGGGLGVHLVLRPVRLPLLPLDLSPARGVEVFLVARPVRTSVLLPPRESLRRSAPVLSPPVFPDLRIEEQGRIVGPALGRPALVTGSIVLALALLPARGQAVESIGGGPRLSRCPPASGRVVSAHVRDPPRRSRDHSQSRALSPPTSDRSRSKEGGRRARHEKQEVVETVTVSEVAAVVAPPVGGTTVAALPSAVQDLARFFLSLAGSSSLGAFFFFFFFFYEWEHRTGTMCPFSSLHPLRKGKEV